MIMRDTVQYINNMVYCPKVLSFKKWIWVKTSSLPQWISVLLATGGGSHPWQDKHHFIPLYLKRCQSRTLTALFGESCYAHVSHTVGNLSSRSANGNPSMAFDVLCTPAGQNERIHSSVASTRTGLHGRAKQPVWRNNDREWGLQ